MHIQVGVAKVPKYASGESGDTLEMVERPHGGVSIVLADGQRHGKSAKMISTMVAHKTVALLADGVRDGAAARAAHDYLYLQRRGRVSATLNIVSVDMVTKTLVISRNSHCPVIIQTAPDDQRLLDDATDPVGVHRETKPEITEIPIELGTVVVVYTDGLLEAGKRRSGTMDIPARVNELYAEYVEADGTATLIADALLADAMRRDEDRPQDDTSVLVIAVSEREIPRVRRMAVTLPIPPRQRP